MVNRIPILEHCLDFRKTKGPCLLYTELLVTYMYFVWLLGKRASVGYEDGTLKVWDLRQGMHTFHLSGNCTVVLVW